METLFQSSFISNASWMSKRREWTKEENKQFESAIAIYDENTPNRWFKVAALLPGKSIDDVMDQYKELVEDVCDIEAGLVPNPGYFPSSITLELVDHCGLQTFRKRGNKSSDIQERKKGVPWTEEEHRRFLMGLEKYGKGDWRNISKKMVISRTPTQVASHAQKYYQRQLTGGKDKRRPSIHDITTFHFKDDSSENNLVYNINSLSKEKFYATSSLQKYTATTDIVNCWNASLSSDEDLMDFGSSYGRSFIAYPYEIASQSWDEHGADDITINANSQIQFESTRYHIWQG